MSRPDGTTDPEDPEETVDLARRPCAECGGEVDPDRYCLRCGTRAPLPRDHYRQQPASWVAGVCDRGLHKPGNEDALALAASEQPGEYAVLVVLDGVSMADDSAAASLAGARAARDVLWHRAAAEDDPEADPLLAAAHAADTAIRAHSDPDSNNPASATFLVVVVERGRLRHGNVGDSRAYWIPDAGAAVQLTSDDAVGNALTKWLGPDSRDPVPRVGAIEVAAPGWVVACTDGLWDHVPSPAALQGHVAAAGAATPPELADALFRLALDAGGHDNITVAVARVGAVRDNGLTDVEEGGSTDG